MIRNPFGGAKTIVRDRAIELDFLRGIAILAVILILNACRFQLEDEDDEPPPTRTARAQDPRCLPGGTWDDTLAACTFPDMRPPPPAIPKLSTGR